MYTTFQEDIDNIYNSYICIYTYIYIYVMDRQMRLPTVKASRPVRVLLADYDMNIRIDGMQTADRLSIDMNN